MSVNARYYISYQTLYSNVIHRYIDITGTIPFAEKWVKDISVISGDFI